MNNISAKEMAGINHKSSQRDGQVYNSCSLRVNKLT